MPKGILTFILTLAITAAFAADPATNRIRTLVKQLGADTHSAREKAQAELLAMPRTVVPVLREFENINDPEIRERLRAVITTILTDPSRVSQTIWTHRDSVPATTLAARTAWNETFAKWIQEGKVSLCETNGRSATSGSFAQSFIPHSRQLSAIAVQAYPLSSALGWVSLDLRPDKEGRPDNSVLARAWLRIEKRCAPHGSFAVFQLPEITLEPEKLHWFVFTEHPDSGEPSRSLTNHRFDSNADKPELQMLRPNGMRQGCAHFLLLTTSPPPPWLREANESEKKTVPTPPASAFEWLTPTEPSDTP